MKTCEEIGRELPFPYVSIQQTERYVFMTLENYLTIEDVEKLLDKGYRLVSYSSGSILCEKVSAMRSWEKTLL